MDIINDTGEWHCSQWQQWTTKGTATCSEQPTSCSTNGCCRCCSTVSSRLLDCLTFFTVETIVRSCLEMELEGHRKKGKTCLSAVGWWWYENYDRRWDKNRWLLISYLWLLYIFRLFDSCKQHESRTVHEKIFDDIYAKLQLAINVEVQSLVSIWNWSY